MWYSYEQQVNMPGGGHSPSLQGILEAPLGPPSLARPCLPANPGGRCFLARHGHLLARYLSVPGMRRSWARWHWPAVEDLPLSPLVPGSPGTPSSPSRPCKPGGPWGPCSPVGPGISTASPGTPLGPGSPRGPGGPRGPGRPRSPLLPFGPTGPCSGEGGSVSGEGASSCPASPGPPPRVRGRSSTPPKTDTWEPWLLQTQHTHQYSCEACGSCWPRWSRRPLNPCLTLTPCWSSLPHETLRRHAA